MAWDFPESFGAAACLSSTFAVQEGLFERVLREPRRNIRIYMDSGWPEDNYEVTTAMAAALLERGYRHGSDLLHLVFPEDHHDEDSWGGRFHVPFQFLFGRNFSDTS
jgi:hypothetical protein